MVRAGRKSCQRHTACAIILIKREVHTGLKLANIETRFGKLHAGGNLAQSLEGPNILMKSILGLNAHRSKKYKVHKTARIIGKM